jgi:16S rRNA (adenine1518-N6/adenine1519-N6)-dimethyltransferase
MSKHRPRKRFGQHFLRDRGVIRHIVDAFAPAADDHVLEIGPGEGALTRLLLERVAPIEVVEFDRDLVARLRAEFPVERLIVHQADALEFDFGERRQDKRLRLIGNLPYNISTPILFHLLEQIDCIRDMVFMLQKEVVDRMAAAPDTPDYGRLSVMIQWQLEVTPLFDVPPEAFDPPPQVDSTVVQLVPHTVAPISVNDPNVFAAVVRAAFANRRKMLRNNLKDVIANDRLEALGIDPTRRAETLTLAEFSNIANALDEGRLT